MFFPVGMEEEAAESLPFPRAMTLFRAESLPFPGGVLFFPAPIGLFPAPFIPLNRGMTQKRVGQ